MPKQTDWPSKGAVTPVNRRTERKTPAMKMSKKTKPLKMKKSKDSLMMKKTKRKLK